MRLMCVSVSLVLALLLSSPLAVSAPQQVQTGEIAWARWVATEFFAASLALPQEDNLNSSAAGFLCLELAAELRDSNKASGLQNLLWAYAGAKLRIKSEAVSPNRCEVIFAGELMPVVTRQAIGETPPWLATEPADVTLWMVKDSGGRWVIRFVRATVRKNAGTRRAKRSGDRRAEMAG